MSNKLFNDNNTDYLIEGAKGKGYLKSGNGNFGDGKASSLVTNYGNDYQSSDNWFEGKQGSKGRGEAS